MPHGPRFEDEEPALPLLESGSLEPQSVEPWAQDEEAFLLHFDLPYPDFCLLLSGLGKKRAAKYEKIRQVHPEAAVLWLIHEGKQHGLVKTVA